MATKKYKVIGERLQDARIKKGWTLDEVQLKLQISKRYLMALEAGEADDLPGDYYTQSLIKQYANLLEVNFSERTLKSEPNSIKQWRREHAEVSTRSQKEIQQKKSILQGLIEQHPWFMGGVLVVVVLLLVWGAFNDMAGQKQSTFEAPQHVIVSDTTKPKKQTKKASKSVKKVEDTDTKVTIVKSKTETNTFQVELPDQDKDVELVMKTGENQSWNALTSTKPKTKTIWQGLVSANDSKKVTLKKDYTYKLKVGDATNFSGKLGNTVLPGISSDNKVQSITIKIS